MLLNLQHFDSKIVRKKSPLSRYSDDMSMKVPYCKNGPGD
jgi:hypothetical protein